MMAMLVDSGPPFGPSERAFSLRGPRMQALFTGEGGIARHRMRGGVQQALLDAALPLSDARILLDGASARCSIRWGP